MIPLEYPACFSKQDKPTTSLHVSAGQSIIIPIRDGINISGALWGSDAKLFVPERWLEDKESLGSEKIQAPNHLLTFGDG